MNRLQSLSDRWVYPVLTCVLAVWIFLIGRDVNELLRQAREQEQARQEAIRFLDSLQLRPWEELGPKPRNKPIAQPNQV